MAAFPAADIPTDVERSVVAQSGHPSGGALSSSPQMLSLLAVGRMNSVRPIDVGFRDLLW
jgi:hypothetical protein